jgi:hypothetical protein
MAMSRSTMLCYTVIFAQMMYLAVQLLLFKRPSPPR